MRIVITGGTGLIGTALTESLIQDGHEVLVLSRNPGKYLSSLPDGARAVEWDASTGDDWYQQASGAHAIVNLAGANLSRWPWTESYKRTILESRLNAGKAVVDAVQRMKQKPGVVVQASGSNYYGVLGDEPAKEDTPPGDDFLANVCVAWGNSTAPVEEMGVRRVVTRSGMVISRQGGALPIMALPVKLFVGGPLGSGRQCVSWIHIDDEVAAIRFLIENQESQGPYNLASPSPISNREFERELGRALHRPSWIPAPAFAIRLIVGEMAVVVLGEQNIVPGRLCSEGFQFKYPTIREAMQALYGRKR